MFRKILPIILSFFIIYTPFFVFAATAPGGGGKWVDKTVTRVGLDDIIEATARQQVIRNGSSVTLEAVVRETVNRQAVGKVLLSRLLAGGLLAGATQSLIEGIGWVMEEGSYVKYKNRDPDEPLDLSKFKYYPIGTQNGKLEDFDVRKNEVKAKYPQGNASTFKTEFVAFNWNTTTFKINGTKIVVTLQVDTKLCTSNCSPSPNYTYGDPKRTATYVLYGVYTGELPEDEKITLTDKLVGDMAVGDYTDPVDSKKDKKDRKWTGVESAYQNDPTGIGNELSDALDDKMDNAPEKPTKPTTPPDTDGEGQKYPTDKDKGTEGTTDQDKDPTTGQPTGSGSFNLPAWCLWAADQCEWHKEDKAHQTEEKTVWQDEKKHRADEKTFWQTVKDWFTWTKDDSDLPERDDSDLNPTVDFEEKNISLNVSPLCPAPTFETITLHGVTSQVKTSDYTYICQLDWLIKPFIIGFATIMACFILFGFNLGSEE